MGYPSIIKKERTAASEVAEPEQFSKPNSFSNGAIHKVLTQGTYARILIKSCQTNTLDMLLRTRVKLLAVAPSSSSLAAEAVSLASDDT